METGTIVDRNTERLTMERAAYLLIFLYFIRRLFRKLIFRSKLPVRRCSSRGEEKGYSRLVITGQEYDLCSNFCMKTPKGFYVNGRDEAAEEELQRMFTNQIKDATGGEFDKVIIYHGKLAPKDLEFDENGEGKGIPRELRGILASAAEEFVRLMR